MDKLVAKVRTEKSYIITIGDTECSPFTKESTWNGLACYKNQHGTIITVDDSNFINEMFEGITGNNDDSELDIIMCSPCFIPTNGEK